MIGSIIWVIPVVALASGTHLLVPTLPLSDVKGILSQDETVVQLGNEAVRYREGYNQGYQVGQQAGRNVRQSGLGYTPTPPSPTWRDRYYDTGYRAGYLQGFQAGYYSLGWVADAGQYQDGYQAGFQQGQGEGFNSRQSGLGYTPNPLVSVNWTQQYAAGYTAGYLQGFHASYLGTGTTDLSPATIACELAYTEDPTLRLQQDVCRSWRLNNGERRVQVATNQGVWSFALVAGDRVLVGSPVGELALSALEVSNINQFEGATDVLIYDRNSGRNTTIRLIE